MLRVTLDSSAYISALQLNGRAARLLRIAADNDIEIAMSEPIIAEVIGVLRERFGIARRGVELPRDTAEAPSARRVQRLRALTAGARRPRLGSRRKPGFVGSPLLGTM